MLTGARRGLTLIEVIVVVGILAVLFGIIYTIASSARKRAKIIACMNNLKQIGIAIRLYREDWGGRPLRKGLPPSYWMNPQSWAKLGLPVWHDWTIEHLADLGYANESVFRCPADDRYPDGGYFYLPNDGAGMFHYAPKSYITLSFLRCWAEQWSTKGEKTVILECRSHNRRGRDWDRDGKPDLIWDYDGKIDSLVLVLRFDGSVGEVRCDVPTTVCGGCMEN